MDNFKLEIIRLHNFRDELIENIKYANIEKVRDFLPALNKVFENENLGIHKRQEDKVRALKNFLLSYNTVYFIAAEKGGLDPLYAHYMAENYAIMIEDSKEISELWHIHNDMILDYADPMNRQKRNVKTEIYQRVNHYINTNFMQEIGIQDVADELDMSKEHVMRKYKDQTGITINEYLITRRIGEAIKLLTYTNMSVVDVSMTVGFGSSSHFSKSFKKVMDKSPQNFREEVKRKNG